MPMNYEYVKLNRLILFLDDGRDYLSRYTTVVYY